MVDTAEEKVWTWQMMVPGTASPPAVVPVTKESIANYARSLLNTNPVFFDDEAAKAAGYKGVVAPLTMCLAYAPHEPVRDLQLARLSFPDRI